jgi:TPR repeat protein
MRKLIVAGIAAIAISTRLVAPATADPLADAEGDRLTRTLAEQGVADDQYALGFMYENGRGVPQDYAEAAKWYRKAADQGVAGAQYNLGIMYVRGQGVPQDYAEALTYVRRSANQGFAPAQFFLGFLYRSGRELYGPSVPPQDYAWALHWFRKAADQGNSSAMSNLGFMYRDGEGVPQDYVQAHVWYNLAVAASKPDQRDMIAAYRDELAAKMTPAQIAEAQRLAREWRPTSPTTTDAK